MKPKDSANLGWGELRPQVVAPARPFIKWAGGKGQALPSLRPYFPPLDPSQTYYEPFLGGGAVFFALRPQRAVLSDINQALITTYRVVEEKPFALLESLRRMGLPETDEDFYRRRKKFNRLLRKVGGNRSLGPNSVRLAAYLIWLNHTCYNGLYRVNKRGEFNVPFGYYELPFIYDEKYVLGCNRALVDSHAELIADDYERVLAGADKGDLAYLDPPYDPHRDAGGFTDYDAVGFDLQDQERLSRVVHDLVDRGCRVVLSNSPSPTVLRLYKQYRTERILVPRAINSVGNRRAKVDELVVIA